MPERRDLVWTAPTGHKGQAVGDKILRIEMTVDNCIAYLIPEAFPAKGLEVCN